MSYIETAASEKIRNVCRCYFLQNNQQQDLYIPISGNSNINNISRSNEDKTDIGAYPASLRIQCHLEDYQKLLLSAGTEPENTKAKDKVNYNTDKDK